MVKKEFDFHQLVRNTISLLEKYSDKYTPIDESHYLRVWILEDDEDDSYDYYEPNSNEYCVKCIDKAVEEYKVTHVDELDEKDVVASDSNNVVGYIGYQIHTCDGGCGEVFNYTLQPDTDSMETLNEIIQSGDSYKEPIIAFKLSTILKSFDEYTLKELSEEFSLLNGHKLLITNVCREITLGLLSD